MIPDQHERLLASRRFLPLFITQFFGAFNDNAFKNAFLIWFTYDMAERSGLNAATMVTLAGGLFILPFFMLSATAGQLADKYQKSWLVQRIKLVEIVLMLAIMLAFYAESIAAHLVLLFLMGWQSTLFSPIKYSLLPEHLKPRELIAGNGLIEGGTFLAILLGTIFGGLVIRLPYGVEILSFSAIFFAILGWRASCYIPKAPVGDARLKLGWNIARETMKIVSFARRERSVFNSILGISWFWLIGATFLTQFPIYAKEMVGGNEQVVTWFLTLFSLGIGVGSVWCNRLLKGKISAKMVPHGCAGMSLSIVLFYVASQNLLPPADGLLSFADFIAQPVAMVISFALLLLAISAGVYIVPLYAIMQHRSENRYVARVIAANNVLNALFMVLASILILALYALGLNVLEILLLTGLLNALVYAALVFNRQKLR